MTKKVAKKVSKVRSRDLTRGLYPLVYGALLEHVPHDEAAARARRLVTDFKEATKE